MKHHAHHGTLAQPTGGIYPFAELPVHLGFPSTTDFEVIYNANGSAVAVAALREFPRISRLCRASGHLLPYRCRYTRQLAPGIHVYDPRFSGLLRHSCDPNVFFDMSELWLWALKDIKKGDPLTMDYAATEDTLLHQFACLCGSTECRGWITGYDEPPNADGQLFFRHWRRRSLC
ncbi:MULTISPECIES: SET domain-containing protein-lysine N-methyltransferase [unclassified Pseudomonas]|uniref:SET domain-containing protein-lysine N-methyltransferase n=1 Tax=unclassified Pseudomonas TaxID=196821 RepID=UPI002AC9B99D|nr:MULTISPECIES: SET domain-containing protein-lysine N-methyltransferase [unclassified Pseudomonas]MEB0047619.1 SET domain-containing protein-lysine N-methyltransferase [Pseudomonas sp. Dout3]MEB0098929.1 SET domain-containing protein-lysine N-methyltransferase [Pseudomonas sp. DC1.2]WPX58068.1 SET domain-containing protein-lysine N-methyltransferase [Pseudomonas sp. DC1.2]